MVSVRNNLMVAIHFVCSIMMELCLPGLLHSSSSYAFLKDG